MAVAMNTGGYFMSDFMISDAAIPMQLNELEAEQTAKFAELLGAFGTADANITEAEKAVLEEAVGAELADMSEEAVNEVLKAVAGGIEAAVNKNVTVKKPEDHADEQLDDTQNAVLPDNAFMMLGANIVVVESASDEFGEITAAAAAADEAAVPAENPEPVQQVQAEPFVRFDVRSTGGAQQDIPAVSAQAQQTVRTDDMQTEQVKQSAGGDNTQSAPEKTNAAGRTDVFVSSEKHSEQPADSESGSSDSGSDLAQTLGGEKAQMLAKAAEKGEISKPEVRTFAAEKRDIPDEKSADAPAEEQPEAPASHATVKNRISSASDELEMLRSARPARQSEKTVQTDTNEAPAANQTAHPQEVRTEISAPEVKREEVVRQTAEIVKTAITENTSDPEKTEYSLTLDPEDLGKITVKLTKAADGAVSVTVAAEKSATQRILEQNSAMLQDSLRNSGVRLENWQTVNASERENYAQDYNGSSKNPYYREEPQNKSDDDGDSTFAELIAAM